MSNIVLNELDWWIASQWEEIPTRHEYSGKIHTTGTKDKSKKYRALRKTRLKECYIVRYADDFKLLCRNYKDAVTMFEATKKWLNDRLGLQVSEEKSKIVNLKHDYSDFLGFRIKVHKKGKKKNGKERYIIKSHISEKAKKNIKNKAKEYIKEIEFCKDNNTEYYAIADYNSYVMGIHNYYKMATCVAEDINRIAYEIKMSIKIRLKERVKRNRDKKIPDYAKKYAKSKEIRFIGNNVLLPIAYIQHKPPLEKEKRINKYTREGREKIHKMLENINIVTLHLLMKKPIINATIEYNDNRISLFVAQNGKCNITKKLLSIEDIHCHHKIPKFMGGNDEYNNLVILDKEVHVLIHATKPETIRNLVCNLKLNKENNIKVNKFRKMAGNEEINIEILNKLSES